MSRLDYNARIKEEVGQLLSRERKQKQSRYRDRVRYTRYLKEGIAHSPAQAGELIGLKQRQSQKIGKQYQQQGLSSLLANHYQGSWGKRSSEQQARLLQRLETATRLTPAQLLDWLKAKLQISYSQSGISLLLARRKVKLKTGRPVNVRQDEAGQVALKKSFPSC